MAIYILIGLVVLLFLIIGGLFALVLKPEWLEWVRSKLLVKTNSNDEPILNPPNSLELIPSNGNESVGKIFIIRTKITAIRSTFSDVHSTREIKLFSVIDNILSFLDHLGPTESFLLDHLEYALDRIDIKRPNNDPFDKMDEIALKLTPVKEMLSYYFSSASLYRENIKPFYESALSEIHDELKKFRKLKAILENAQTIEVYQLEKDRHSQSYRNYLYFFFLFISCAFAFAYLSIDFKEQIVGLENKNIIDYWILKASGMFIFITLITFFLKQAIHHQKKRDQVEKTMLELKALPAYMAELKSDDATHLRKELASKYFGNSTDNSTINDLSNIINEQLKNSTEVARTAVEMIKANKPK